MQDPEIKDVADFHRKFGQIVGPTPGHLTPRKLAERVRFLQEELDELKKAGAMGDLDGVVDALVDLVYVAKGTAAMLGLEKTWHRHWGEVQRANMAKVRGVGVRGNKVDVVKPEGWTPPEHLPALISSGYDISQWLNEHGQYAGRDDSVNAQHPDNEGYVIHLDGEFANGQRVVDGGP